MTNQIERVKRVIDAYQCKMGLAAEDAWADAEGIAEALSEAGLLTKEAAQAEAAGERIAEAIRDPNAVHVNMLRGSIARPSVAQIIHIYGEDAFRAALAPPPTQDVGEAERLRTAIQSEIDRLRKADSSWAIGIRKRLRAALSDGSKAE
jgi:hypothetical protein